MSTQIKRIVQEQYMEEEVWLKSLPTQFSTTDLMNLIDTYAEARHMYGAPEYNVKSREARNAVEQALTKLPIANAVFELRSKPSSSHD